MGEGKICCCQAHTWTVGIGWFQVIRGALILCGIFYIIWTHPLETSSNSRILTGAAAILIVLSILDFIMGTVLLRGFYSRNITQIHGWITSVVFSTAVIGIAAGALCYLRPDVMTIGASLIGFTVILMFNGFALWAVGGFKNELLQASQGSLAPLVDDV